MHRRELFRRALAFIPAAAGALLFGKRAEAAGLVGTITRVQPSGDFKGDKFRRGDWIIFSFVRSDNGRTVHIAADKKTKIFLAGSRIKFFDLRDELYYTPAQVSALYEDLPIRVLLKGTQLAKRLDIDF